MAMNRDLERMCKEVVMSHFEVLFQQLPGGTDKRHEKFESREWNLGIQDGKQEF
jgi:hypothetical protein